MRKINNLEILKPFLTFENEGDFYFLQIIKRKTENPEMPKSQRLVENYYIYNLEYLEDKFPIIIDLCEENKARAYLRLNRRNDEKIALQTLKSVAEHIANKSYKIRNCYDSACGKFMSEPNKKWLIDIDDTNFNEKSLLKTLKNEIRPIGDKLYAKIPTPNGYHLITRPFVVLDFVKKFKLDVHKDNPTILYT